MSEPLEKRALNNSFPIAKYISFFLLISSSILNPWAGKYWHKNFVNFNDVLMQYFVTSVLVGVFFLALHKYRSYFLKGNSLNIAVLTATILLLILSDRFLLAVLGLPLWMPDMDNHYRHRPGIVRSWGPMYGNKVIRTNKFGHHDNDFPLAKSDNEFRALMLGDSITMGHGVTREETYSNQLEGILEKARSAYGNFQIINAGVQGYSTFQELNVLKKSMRFKPDFVAVGFCMNDVQEPFVINKDFGGVGIDYHGVTQVFNLFTSYLINETGYGRIIQTWRARPEYANWCRDREIDDVKYMASSARDNPHISAGWDNVLSSLEELYELTAQNDINAVLLIFPHTFQLMNEDLQQPQRILRAHAKQNNVDFIDFTTFFENLTSGQKDKVERYFLDLDHYTPEGHNLVARKIGHYLQEREYLVR